MVQNDRKPLLQQRAAERMAVELRAMVELHEELSDTYYRHGFEEARYVESFQEDMYRSFYRKMKGMCE